MGSGKGTSDPKKEPDGTACPVGVASCIVGESRRGLSVISEIVADIWWKRAKGCRRLLEIPLAAASLLYRVGLGLDQSRKAKRARRLPRPVVSVGNVTVGGTGKTPVTLWLARQVEEMGKIPCILSRGYGSEGKKPRRVEPGCADWRKYGDEPVLLADRLGTGKVYVGQDRWRAGYLALEEDDGIDLFLLDDGFQHRQLARDRDVVLVDAERHFGNNRLLPWGPLREPMESLSRADFVGLIHRSRAFPSSAEALSNPVELPIALGPIGWSVPGERRIRPLSELSGDRPAWLLSGIGHPQGFEQTVRECGLEVAHHSIYRDHHPYSRSDLQREIEAAGSHGARLVTTAKDAVRMRNHLSIWTRKDDLTIIELGVIAGDGLEYLRNVLKELLAEGS